MNIIEKLSPQRNQSIYSSQRQLIEDDNTSDDVVVGTLHEPKIFSYINEALEIEEAKPPIRAFVDKKVDDSTDNENVFQTLNSTIAHKTTMSGVDKLVLNNLEHRKKKKRKKEKVDKEESLESTLSPSASSSKSNTDNEKHFGVKHSLKAFNSSEDEVLIINKIIDSTNSDDGDESSRTKFSIQSKSSRRNKRAKTPEKLNIKTKNEENIEMKSLKNSLSEKDKTNITAINKLKIIGTHILKSDLLENHMFLCKPLVKIYIVDYTSGHTINADELPQKQNGRHVGITKAFDFSKNRKIVPEWNEIILFDNDVTEKIISLKNVIIFFEIVEEITKSDISSEKKTYQSISWAFIKPLGHNHSSNMNKKLKLQLYDIGLMNSHTDSPDVYEWWKSKPWKKYPSTLDVIVMSLKCNDNADAIDRIKSSISSNHEHNIVPTSNKYITDSKKSYILEKVSLEKKSAEEQTEIPNKIISLLNNLNGNTTMLKFSTCGKFLAFSALDNNNYLILIYKIPEFEETVKLSHHKGLIYDICWNSTANQLLTASADGSACVWNISDLTKWTKQKLRHDTFVYTAKFCKCNENVIVTGCYDKIVRVWIGDSNSKNRDIKYELDEELAGHTGYVNTICFLDKKEMFFSADSEGVILKWSKAKDGWVKIQDINIQEFNGKVINDIQLFPDNNRMLIVIRNHTPWTINTSSTSTFICYKDGLSIRYQVRGCISPCGTFVLVGSNIWKASTGELCATINPVHFDHHPIMSLDLHPFYNLLAMSCDQKNTPLLLCSHFHENFIDHNLGLEIHIANMIYCNKTSKEDDKQENTRRFKEAVHKLDKLQTKPQHKNKRLKLWDLLHKMDDLLIKAKQSEPAVRAIKKDTHKEYFKQNISDSETGNTPSVNLTDFYQKMNLKYEQREKISPGQTESDTSNCLGTYTLENKKPVKLKKAKKKTKKGVNGDNIEESSTMSNAESLEDDQNTYTIMTNAQKSINSS